MSIADRSPAPNAQIETGDLFSCEITHTGASAVTVTVDGELAWSLAGGGQAGFTVAKATLSEVTTISVTRDAGWAGSPVVVEVEITGGAEAGTTSWTYYVGTQTAYPPGTQPYHDTLETGITASQDLVPVVEDLSQLDIDSASMTVLKTADGRAKLFGYPNADSTPSFWDWGYETGGGVPSSGKFTADSDSIASITSISLNDTSGAGPVIAGAGVNIKVGDYIVLKSASLHATYLVTTATDNVGYWTYGVLFGNGVGPTLTDTSNYEFGFLSTGAAGGFHGFGEFEFDVTTAKADPTAGKFRLNNATQASATEMYISQEDSSGATLDNALNSLQSGDTIRLQSRTQARVQVYTVNGTVVDEGVYKTVPLAHVSAGSSDLSDTDECSLVVLRAVPTSATSDGLCRVTFASGGGTPGTAEVTTNTTNWAAAATIKIHERDLDSNNIMTPWLDRLRIGDHIGLRESTPGGFGTSTSGNFLIDSISYASNVYTIGVTPYANNGGTPLAGDVYEVFLGFTANTSGGGNNVGMAQYAYVSGGGAPASLKFTADTDLMSTITTLNLNDTSGGGMGSFSIAYGNVKAGDIISLANNDASGFAGTFRVVSSVDNGTYWTFTVTPLNVVGSFVAADDYDMYVISDGGAPGVPVGGGVGTYEYVSNTSTPGLGEYSFDNVTPSSASTVYMHITNQQNLNSAVPLNSLRAGDFLYFGSLDTPGTAIRCQVTGPTSLAASVISAPINTVAQSATPAANEEMFVNVTAKSTDDETEVSLDGDTSTQQELNQGWDGATLDDTSVTVAVDTGVWYANLEKSGGGDVRFRFGGTTYTLDCTPIDTVALTAGTAVAPQINYVFVVESGGTLTLTANTTGFPALSARVATVFVQDVTTGATDGPFKVHAWTDHVSGSSNGHISDINAKLRALDATWVSGVVSSPLTEVAPDAYIQTTAGVVFQLHEHTFPALDMNPGGGADPAWVVNDPTTAYLKITSLADITQDSAGGSTVNKSLSLVLWGAVNEVEADCKYFINLPSGTYNNSADAADDAENYTDFNIPPEFKGVGFLIARFNVSESAGGNWTEDSQVDLRGLTPAGSPSASTGSGDVVGPASVIGGAVVKFDGTTGKLIKGGDQLLTDSGELQLQGISSAVRYAERATGPTGIAGKGHVWVRSDTPTVPMFTNDAGTDSEFVRCTFPGAFGTIVTWSTGDSLATTSNNFTYYDVGYYRLLLGGAGATVMIKEAAAPVAASAAGYGSFWVRDDAPTVPMFRDDAGTSKVLGPQTMCLPFGYNLSATTAGYHYGQDPESPWKDVFVSAHSGNGADPTMAATTICFVAPFDGKLTDIRCWYRVETSTVAGVIEIYKFTWTSGSATYAASQLHSDLTVATGGDTTFKYDVGTAVSTSNDVSAGDLLALFFKPDTSGTGKIWMHGTLTLEKS